MTEILKKLIIITIIVISMVSITGLILTLIFNDSATNFYNQIYIQLYVILLIVLLWGIIIYYNYSYLFFGRKDKSLVLISADSINLNTYQAETNKFFGYIQDIFHAFGSKKKYLKNMPWYLVLGNPKSGKTTLLTESNLNYISINQFIKNKIDRFDNYKWHFTEQGIFIEYSIDSIEEKVDSFPNLTEFNSPFLQAIFNFLKKYHIQNCLNGVLIPLDLLALIKQSELDTLAQKSKIKIILDRIQYLFTQKIPVYLIGTKGDLIAGFREFFSDLDQEKCKESWGINFFNKHFINEKEKIAYFTEKFDTLLKEINKKLLYRLLTEQKLENRLLMSYFPQQIQPLKKIISEFLFYNENMPVLGIYFSSSLQNGSPSDNIMNSFLNWFSLENQPSTETVTSVAHNYAKVQKNLFLYNKFFTDLISPAVYVSINTYYLKRNNLIYYWRKQLCLTALLIISSFLLYLSYLTNQAYLNTINQTIIDLKKTASNLDKSHYTLNDILVLLKYLKNIHSVYNDNRVSLVWIEGYEPLKLSHEINKIWYKTLSKLLLPYLKKNIELLLAVNDLDSEIAYFTLKAYLVFNPDINIDSYWLKPYSTYYLDNNSNYIFKQLFNNYLSELIQHPIYSPLIQSVHGPLIEKVRNKLRQLPFYQLVYFEIKNAASHTLNQLTLDKIVGADFYTIFEMQLTLSSPSSLTIPEFYTKRGFLYLKNQKTKLLNTYITQVYTLLGLKPNSSTDNLLLEIKPHLMSLYKADLIKYWEKILINLQLISFTSLSQAIQLLDILTSDNNPLFKLLEFIRINSDFLQPKENFITNLITGFNYSVNKNPVSVADLNIINILSSLRNFLTTLNNAPNPAQAEFQQASSILQNKSPNNPIVLLKLAAQKKSFPLKNWLMTIVNQSMQLLLQGSYQTIATAWKNELLPYYHVNIEGRFPFSSSSNLSVNIINFSDFLGQNGIFYHFLQMYVSPFGDIKYPLWNPYKLGNIALGLDLKIIHQLQYMDMIRNLYFQNGTHSPVLQFSIRPIYLDPKSSSVSLQLANINITYRHGPLQTVALHWPFGTDNTQVSLSFNDFQGNNYSCSFEGPWSWFKLLSFGNLHVISSGHYIWQVNQSNHLAIFELSAVNNLPIFDLKLLQNLNLFEMPNK